ncbi:MAG: putative 3-hydroxybutyryl-CoA dehydrogenase [Acidimicrobiia bacterium]|nr:MAG: putative 3-hydroxybutyryl-CoA dehydrogenase [Acidimicrobiia bacterium]
MKIQRIGIVGGGLMGSGIAEVAARAGSDVLLSEPTQELLDKARQRIVASLDRAVERQKLSESDRDAALGRITFTTDLSEFEDRQLVIEAVTEDEDLKKEIFRRLDDILGHEEAILASNTSSIPITRLAAATGRPERVVGMHFFNPVPVMALMELVTTVRSSAEVEAIAEDYAANTLGKTVIRAKDRAGFVVNMLLVPYLLGAIRMYEAGFASARDIDTGMKLGANHPMGPLELCDFIGLDTMKHVADVLFDEYKEPMYASPPLLTRMVEAGMLGRKTGRGFYEY